MSTTSLITGVNGHLGNNLLHNLLEKGENVIGTVRNMADFRPDKNFPFTPVYADLLDKESLRKALQGVNIVYQVAAVFKLWTPNSLQDIYDANMLATRNIMEVAAEQQVKRIVYVSSIAAMGRTQLPIHPETFNTERENIYYRSKIDSEKLAWELADTYGLDMVSVCPSAMIGGNCHHLTPSFRMLRMVLNGEVFADSQFYINWVDVKDVAEGCTLAAKYGRSGQRYGLGTPNAVGLTEIIRIAQDLYPFLRLKIPVKMPKWLLSLSASYFEAMALISGKEPMLQRNQVRMYYKVVQDMDIQKSQKELGYQPKLPEEAIKNALHYLMQHPNLV